MTNPITPEAVERFGPDGAMTDEGLLRYCQKHRAPNGPFVRASDYYAIARELAEVKAERDAARATNLDLHRRTQEAESRAYKQAGRMKRKVNRVWGWYYTAVDIAKADFHRAIKAEADLATARAQIVAARRAVGAAKGIFANCSVEAGCCCCGDSMKNHPSPMICGHTPVDMGAYQTDLWIKEYGDIPDHAAEDDNG